MDLDRLPSLFAVLPTVVDVRAVRWVDVPRSAVAYRALLLSGIPSRIPVPIGSPPPPFHRHTRDERIERLDREEFDLLVIGGGITGAGIARDAAMRGLRTVLVEKNDIGSGTSQSSSKLVHGGFRYLEQGQIRLVWESVNERARLGLLAPHMVRPVPFLFPVYDRRPRPLWMIQAAVWIYELLALFRVAKLHRRHSARATLELEPTLREEGLNGSLVYYDSVTDDARLTLLTAKSAHGAGAWILPYAAVVEFIYQRGQIQGAIVEDRRTGQARAVKARVVVNATGPWTDRLLGLREVKGRLLRPTKGVHLVLPGSRLEIRHTVVLTNRDDRRVAFAIPSGNRVILGTTDTDFDGDFDHVGTNAADAAYLLDLANEYFPRAKLGPQDVLGTWAGLRPLVAAEGLSESEIPREHLIRQDDDGLITVCGGKLTTYRLMAAEVMEAVAVRLRTEGVHVGRCPTGSVFLPGGGGIAQSGSRLVTLGLDGEAADREAGARFGEDVAEHLRENFGGEWIDVAARAHEDPALGQRLVDDLPTIWAQVDHAVEAEMAVGLSDVMRRRTQLQLRAHDQGRSVAPAVAQRMARLLGWSQQDAAAQVLRYEAECDALMAWRRG